MSSNNSMRPLVLALSMVMMVSGPGSALASGETAVSTASASSEAQAETTAKQKETKTDTKSTEGTSKSESEETSSEAKETSTEAKETSTEAKEISTEAKETSTEAKETSSETKETSSGTNETSSETKDSASEESSSGETTAEETTGSSEESSSESESSEESQSEESSSDKETKKDKETTEDESEKESSSSTDKVYTYYDDGPITATIPEEYRFTQISKKPVVLKDGTKVYTEKSEEADVVAEADGDTAAYIIKDGDPWVYIESGYVRGFVEVSSLTEGDEAKLYCQQYEAWLKEQQEAAGADTGTTVSAVANSEIVETITAQNDSSFGTMDVKINHMDNPAFDYTLTTTMDVTIEKVYAIADEDIKIYDNRYYSLYPDQEAASDHVIGTLEKGGLAYITADGDRDIVFIESGDVRGFVRMDQLTTGDKAESTVKDKGEYSMTTAEGETTPDKNRAFYYSVASVFKAGTGKRNAVTAFALQFVGNKYVWGGTSLTKGCDCSGFIQSIYRHFGYSLPRTSAAQRHAGKNVGTSLKNALPGDIICYDGHVALYLGDGKIVHASNHHAYPRGGIKVSNNANYRRILTIRRIIND